MRPSSEAPLELRTYNGWLRERYGERIHRVSVDAGFTCPNRDGTKGRGGCTYCNVDSFTPATARRIPSIREQIEKGAARAERLNGAKRFIAYFQPNTNTYAPVETLRPLYDEAVSVLPERTVGLAVGTRPDCIDGEKLDLLESYSDRLDVTLELGLESANDATLLRINRGHDHATFLRACESVRGRKIDLGVHIILGFPWEDRDEWLRLAEVVNALPIRFLKIHQLHVVKGSILAAEWKRSPFPLFTLEEYADLLAEFLPRLRPDLVIQRLFGSAPPAFLVAPEWPGRANESQSSLLRLLAERHIHWGPQAKVAFEA